MHGSESDHVAHFSSSVYLPVTPAESCAWHLRPGTLERLLPPWEQEQLQQRTELPLNLFSEYSYRAPGAWSGTRLRTMRIEEVRTGACFIERQIQGPWRIWRHEHRFEPEDDGCRMVDEIDFEPAAGLGRSGSAEAVQQRLENLFTWRCQRALADIGRHRDAREDARLLVAVSGAEGLVGSELVAFLRSGGNRVLPLRRGPAHGFETCIAWDPAAGTIQTDALAGVDAVVHLAGSPVGVRWTASQRERILSSRVHSTRLLAQTLARLPRPPSVLVVASAIGWYGDAGEQLVDEASPPGIGFLPEVCAAWEAACEPARQAGIRVINLRIGVVLSGRGGALARLRAPFRYGVGVVMGDGRQWTSWVAIDDLVYLIHLALRSRTLQGPVNAVAPTPVRHQELIEALGRILERKLYLRLPPVAVRTLLGAMGQELLLSGSRVISPRARTGDLRLLLPGARACPALGAWPPAPAQPSALLPGLLDPRATRRLGHACAVWSSV